MQTPAIGHHRGPEPAPAQARTGAAGLRIAVALAGLVPVGAGLAGVLQGTAMLDQAMGPAADSHYRYLSGLLLGIGLGFWSTLPDPARRTGRFRLLTGIVVLGGLGRLFGLFALAAPWPAPGLPMLAALGMELVVTPLLCLWQGRLARRRP